MHKALYFPDPVGAVFGHKNIAVLVYGQPVGGRKGGRQGRTMVAVLAGTGNGADEGVADADLADAVIAFVGNVEVAFHVLGHAGGPF